MFFEKYKISESEILDIGCGGGFPCLPIAIEFPNFRITGIDSIRKKIASVQNISEKLGLENLELIADRVENIKERDFDLVVSRAVADMAKISEYALPKLKKGGYFVAYKSKKALEELNIEMFDSEGKFRGLEVILKELNVALADCTEEEKNNFFFFV